MVDWGCTAQSPGWLPLLTTSSRWGNISKIFSVFEIFSGQVREGGSQTWLDTFTLLTECTAEKFCNTTGMFDNLEGWSNSYLNFEMKEGVEVEVKLTRLYGEPVTKAVVHPREAVRRCEVREGEVFLSLDRPALFTVDINGQMEDQDTGRLQDNNE